jgi:RimJ/RimL family protein N-acetyltransferase
VRFNVPNPISTERLILRAPRPDDAPALNEAILETWEQLNRWMPWAVQKPSLQASAEVCMRMAQHWSDLRDFPLFGFEQASGRFILAGGCHLKDPEVPLFEIGYWCRASDQGRGYVTEAVQAITRVAFDEVGAKRIEIRCDGDNTSSAAVARRCGFRLEAELVNGRRNVFGTLANTLIFSQTRPD